MTDSRFLDRKLVDTGDGSHSLYLPACDESYHSSYGALAESLHVFIGNGYEELAGQGSTPLQILEIGFGAALNALLSWDRSRHGEVTVVYTAVEAFPVTWDVARQLNYADFLSADTAQEVFAAMHRCPWGVRVKFGERFSLLKWRARFEDFQPAGEDVEGNEYDLVYYDAFSPQVQPELWTRAIFDKLKCCMRSGAVLVTYCAKGEVKRLLKAAGFALESLPGPPGKREMMRARKP